ncbi:hypothetical protein NMN56_014785 [Streptomyces iconiensis]|uniref:NADPH-dependent reductive aminase-like C-terminal domain-containing protein n=1 Tax=Streptomyces iconiensis TaxID=1384038 RepID=A0ABT6ZVW1_9ACTN|nr:hypothetical protein [Streptomyces iconiensis]
MRRPSAFRASRQAPYGHEPEAHSTAPHPLHHRAHRDHSARRARKEHRDHSYSGPEAVLEAHGTTLDALAGTRTHLGEDPGRAAAYDVALLDFFWTSVSGFAHSLALARSEHIEARELAPFAHGISSILPMMIDDFAERVDKGEHGQPSSELLSASTAMRHIAHTAQANGLDTGVLQAARTVVDRAVTAGHGPKDLSYLATVQGASRGEAGQEAGDHTAG